MVLEMLARHSVGKRLGGSNPSYGVGGRVKRIGKSRMVHTHEIIGLTPMSAISEFCCSQNENFCCYVALLKLIFQYKKQRHAIIAQW